MEKIEQEPKIGDKVISESSYHGMSVLTIERFTKTTAVLNNGIKLRMPIKHDTAIGYGGGYGSTYYELATPEKLLKYERQQLERRVMSEIGKLKLKELTNDRLTAILKALTL